MSQIINPKRILSFYIHLIRENKVWLLFTALILVGGFLSGIVFSLIVPSFGEKMLQDYANSIDIDVKKGWDLSWYIFQRNITIITLASFLGAVFGVTSFFVTFINGLILGVVMGFLPVYESVNLLQLLVLILPHGVFEYTATLLCLSFGLRLGLNWVLNKKEKSRRKVFFEDLRKLVAIYPLVFVLLALASLIEGFLTLEIACFLGGFCK